jgi:hypothetical protein
MVSTYNATFLKRTDFELLQLLEFSGYTDQIPDGEYRIIEKTNTYENGGVVNEVTVKLVPKAQFSAQLRLQRVFKSSVKTIRAIAKDELNKMGKPETGYVKAIDGNDITFVNDRGLIRHVSDGS